MYSAAAFISASKGDSAAATLYLAAAKQKNAEAGLLEYAAANSDNRARFFLAASVPSPPSAAEELVDSQNAGDGADYPESGASAARLHEYCKNAANIEYSSAGIHMILRPGTWCHKGPKVTRVDFGAGSADGDVTGPQALDVHFKTCYPVERDWYNWKGHGSESGRKLTETCVFKTVPGIATMYCTASMYFHSDGSRYYQKTEHCRVSLF